MKKVDRTAVNIASSMLVLLVDILVSFFMAPYIVKNIGIEANGFVSLAGSFVTYAALVVSALNSMAARFITFEYVRENYKKSNLYYNSVFWGNLIIVAVFLGPALFVVFRMEHLVNVPADILGDVKLLFFFVFFNFLLPVGMPNWECGVYIKNRLDLTYFPTALISVLRCIFLFTLFIIFKPHVWFVGIATTFSVICTLAVDRHNTHMLTPELHIGLRKNTIQCSWSAIKELVGSGIWNSMSSAGNMLLSGLDLLICNLFISPTAMGVLSLAKMLPNYMGKFSTSICRAFLPEVMINFATNNKEKMLKDLNRACKITGTMLVVPLSGIVVMSRDFFELWVPGENAGLLSAVAIVTCMGYAFTSGVQVLTGVFQTANKVKENALSLIISGVISTATVFILLGTTDLGIFAIAGVSTAVSLMRHLFFVVPYASKYLGFRRTQFSHQIILSVVSTCTLVVIGSFVHTMFKVTGWPSFLLCAAVIGVINLSANMLFFLNCEEKKIIMRKFRRK